MYGTRSTYVKKSDAKDVPHPLDQSGYFALFRGELYPHRYMLWLVVLWFAAVKRTPVQKISRPQKLTQSRRTYATTTGALPGPVPRGPPHVYPQPPRPARTIPVVLMSS